MRTPTQEQFLADVSTHQLTVLHESGVYRHLRFKRPNRGVMHFDIVTWPGYLAYSGDMGCFVFRRLEDMLEFFRTDGGQINPGYWSEKLLAVDGGRGGGKCMEFSEDKFRKVINEYRLRWLREYRDTLSKEERRELWEAVDDDVLTLLDTRGEGVMHAAYNFSYEVGGEGFEFDDLFEHGFREFTYHFIWCCYAIAWGIQQYDLAKAQEVAA